MNRNTIDFGIDLGTTNSEIAVIEGNDVHIFKNNENTENTPSAIYIDRRERLFVGRKAKDRAEEDPDNVRVEFKRDMGLQQQYSFAATGRVLTPEECSAEVLKSLRSDVQQRTGEDVRAAVITVPAMFELPACDATRRAAQLAGIENAPLLQEPIAAAIAYGFQADADNVFWLVYDLGGGTFDASLVSVRDGRISVVDHDGENHLGGKDFDWLLIEELVLPELRRQYRLDGLQRGNAKYRTALAKLKAVGEKTKIELSRRPSAILELPDLCDDERGTSVDVDIEITQEAYARVIAPAVERSLSICRRILERNKIGAGEMEKLILVGGPTLTPALRGMLQQGLNIPLDVAIDPITAVARGAAIFAGAQPLGKDVSSFVPAAPGVLQLDLAYEPITPDSEPFIGGKLQTNDGGAPAPGHRIEFVRSDGLWRSGLIPINEGGAFSIELRLQERKPNTFHVEVQSAQGSKTGVQPASFTMTHGLGVDNPPLPRSLGVALADNKVQVYLAKDTQLPARGRAVHRTARAFTAGVGDELLHIPIVEGEHPRANRNRLIGTLAIPGHKLRRDLRAGAEIEVRIEMDASRALKMSAYIPDLDQEFDEVQGQTSSVISTQQVLGKELAAQRERLKFLHEDVNSIEGVDAQEARNLLFMLEMQDTLQDIERLVAASGDEADAAKTADERLKDFAAQLDRAEDLIEWPKTESDALRGLESARQAVERSSDSNLHGQLRTLESELQAALRARDKETVAARTQDAGDLWFNAHQSNPNFWIALYESAREKPVSLYRDSYAAQRLLEQGQDALNRRDIQNLRRIVNDLFDLLPVDERATMTANFGSGIM
jgi:molecular chaperone DnaK